MMMVGSERPGTVHPVTERMDSSRTHAEGITAGTERRGDAETVQGILYVERVSPLPVWQETGYHHARGASESQPVAYNVGGRLAAPEILKGTAGQPDGR